MEEELPEKPYKAKFVRAVETIIANNRKLKAQSGKPRSFAEFVEDLAAYDSSGRITLNLGVEGKDYYDVDDDDDGDSIDDDDVVGNNHVSVNKIARQMLQQQQQQRESNAMGEQMKKSNHASVTVKIANVPCMSICIMIVGTRGDVQPFIGIAKRLQEDGHRVRLATHAVYREFVTSYDVEFYPLGGDPKELAAYMVKTGGHLIPLKLETIQKDVPRNMQMIDEILNSTWPAVSEADPDAGGKGIPGEPFQAQAIISNPVTYGHIHVAERLGVPLHIMFPQPWVPTVEFPHPLSNLPYKNKRRKLNYLSYKAVDLLMWQGTESIVNKFRKKVLGLRKIRKGDGGRDILLDLAIPHAFMWSPALVPKPADWGKIYDVVGTVTLKEAGSKYTPTPELEAFLGNDDGPIFVGFGSMVLKNPLATTKMIIDAAAQAKVRVLIQSSWSDMSGDIVVPDNIFFLGNCPHDWLMPRVSAVVHHGGAGTTAAGLLAGKPTFIVPFFGDQPFWGRAVVTAGVGVEPCPISKLTVEKLRIAFEGLKSPELRQRAEIIRDVMQKEDGVEEAVKSFYRHLPIHDMRCDLDCNRAATKWSQKDKMKLCNDCEFVVTSRPENSQNDIIDYQIVDYAARGPNSVLEGASSGAAAFLHELGSGMKDIFCKPMEGYREAGAAGAMIGVFKGIAGVVVYPVRGAALFADHIVTGHYNQTRKPDERKKGSKLLEHRKFLRAIGVKLAPEAHTAAMSPDEMICLEKILTERQIALRLSADEKQHLKIKVREIINRYKERSKVDGNNASVSCDDQLTPISSENSVNTVPKMNICMMTTGSWEESVQQYIAIGLRLEADGHRVRIATNTEHRDRVSSSGLEFYPLGGRATATNNFLNFVTYQYKKLRKNAILGFFLSKLPTTFLHKAFTEINDLRELTFSLWPACVNIDLESTSKPFRADAIIADPYMFGQVFVAERLGVPLHCMSASPLSKTHCFPHFIDPSMNIRKGYAYAKQNLATYDFLDKLIWKRIKRMLDGFRASLGLTGKSTKTNLLAEWRIPHTYLWNEQLLPKPTDWGSEVAITGYVRSDENIDSEDIDQLAKTATILASFIAKASTTPLLYFGLGRAGSSPQQLKDLLANIEKAASAVNVRVIFQAHEEHGDIPLHEASTVLEVYQHFPIHQILPHVVGAIHWGDLSITSSCLAAAKPACVIPRNMMQQLWSQAIELAGVGVHYLDASALSAENLARAFQELLQPQLATNAQKLAATFSSQDAVDNAVKAFYSHLPLASMTCDIDPSRIARVYNPKLDLKLSYEAYLAVRQLTQGDETKDLKYKPLQYSLACAPRFSLRRLNASKSTSTTKTPSASAYAYTPEHLLAAKRHSNQKKPKSKDTNIMKGYQETMDIHVVEASAFWSYDKQVDETTKCINTAYEKLLAARKK